MDQEGLCRRFIQDDLLTKEGGRQKSPFTGMKIVKGSPEYFTTIRRCKDVIEEKQIKRTKKTQVPVLSESILPLVASVMSQRQRRELLGSVPVVGSSKRTKNILESERDEELLTLPEYKNYVFASQMNRIDFSKLAKNESFQITEKAYPIFLKYFTKGLPIPREIEDYFDNLSDDFYKKLLDIAVKQKLKLSSYLLTVLMSRNFKITKLIEYFQKVLRQPFPEKYIETYIEKIDDPTSLLLSPNIKDDSIFATLLSKKKLSTKLFDVLVEKYVKDPRKLILLHYFSPKKASTEKLQYAILSNAKIRDFESIFDLLSKEDYESSKSYKDMILLYIDSVLRDGATEDTERIFENLLFRNNQDNTTHVDIFGLWKRIFPESFEKMRKKGTYVDFLLDVYSSGDMNDFTFLKFVLDEIKDDPKMVDAFLKSLRYNYDLDPIEVIGDRKNELSKSLIDRIYK